MSVLSPERVRVYCDCEAVTAVLVPGEEQRPVRCTDCGEVVP